MTRIAICLGLLLAIWWEDGVTARAANTRGLVAIDVLLLPDATMTKRARALNRRLLRDWPAGFALDATHVPHMTLFQCYVRAAVLDAVATAVGEVFRRTSPKGMELAATGLFDSDVANISATGISVKTTPALARLQQAVAIALSPFIRQGGGSAAFVDTPTSATIGWTIDYVAHFLTNSSGTKFSPHVTAGVASPEFVARLRADRFPPFRFKISGAAVYQLGDVGTARQPLWKWRP